MSESRAILPTKRVRDPGTLAHATTRGASAPMPSQGTIQRAQFAPHALSSQEVMALQRSMGNRAVSRLLQRSSDGESSHPTQDIGMQGGEVDTETARSIHAAKGSGQRMDHRLQRQMEGSIGANFSQVKLHTDRRADKLNRSLNARAFTTGTDVFFRQGEYQPHSRDGQKLIAHELTHVVQQGHGGVGGSGVGGGGMVQRLVDTEIAQMEDIKQNVRYFGNKDKKVLKALQKYNLYMRQGGAPTPKVKRSLQKVQDMVADMIFSTDKKKVKDPYHETRERTLQQIHLRLAKEIQDLGSYREMSWSRKLGSGQMNTVWETSFDDGLKGVFKQDEPISADELDPEKGTYFEGRPSGIDARDTNLGSRNIAMYKLDQLLGTGVIPRTERAVHGDKVGTVMEKVEGRQLHVGDQAKDLKTSLNIDYADEVVQRGMSNLQLLDMICGQTDRHGANVMVTKDEHGNIVGVRGIDNDLSFGVDNDGEQFISQDMGLPSFIDWQVAQNILQITPSDIRETLTGLLTVAEINKTIERFETAKAYIEALITFEQAFARGEQTGPAPRGGKLVRHWDQATYGEQLDTAKERIFEEYAQSRNKTMDEAREMDLDRHLEFKRNRTISGSYLFAQSYELERITKLVQEQGVEGIVIKDP